MAAMESDFVVLTVILFVSCLTASDLDFLDAPINITKGDSWKVECRSAVPAQWIYYHGNVNQTLAETGNPRVVRLNNHSLQLTISNADYSHRGRYVCQEISERLGRIIYMQLKIEVKDKRSSYCSEQMFECLGRCIAKRFLCDKIEDCVDGADEKNCPVLCDYENHFVCVSGQCINATLRCDKEQVENCRDGSDEIGCPDRIYKYTGQVQSPEESGPSQTMLYKKQTWHSHGIYGIVVAVMGLIFTITVIVVTICRIHMRRDAQLAMISRGRGRTRTHTLSTTSETRDEPSYMPYHQPSTSTAVFLDTGPATLPGELKGLIVSPPPYSTLDRTANDTPPPPYDNIDDPLYRPQEVSVSTEEGEETENALLPRTEDSSNTEQGSRESIPLRPQSGGLNEQVRIGPL